MFSFDLVGNGPLCFSQIVCKLQQLARQNAHTYITTKREILHFNRYVYTWL